MLSIVMQYSTMLQAALVLALLFSLSATVEICGPSLTWKTANGKILLNDHPFVLKGVGYYGFEDKIWAPTGLGTYDLNPILDFVKNKGFNALRIPFSMELVQKNPPNPNVNCNTNPAICHLNALNLMNAIIDRCAERGIMVLLDSHILTARPDPWNELWYNNEYPETEVLHLWDVMFTRFATKWNLLALDIKNEPHGQATWGKNQSTTDFNLYAERFINHISTAFPQYKGLFFVEGIEHQSCHPETTPTFWGENLQGVGCAPIHIVNPDVAHRVIYSPHLYGLEEANEHYFSDANFPNNMPAIWQAHFGFVPAATGDPVVIGEWGWDQSGSKGEV